MVEPKSTQSTSNAAMKRLGALNFREKLFADNVINKIKETFTQSVSDLNEFHNKVWDERLEMEKNRLGKELELKAMCEDGVPRAIDLIVTAINPLLCGNVLDLRKATELQLSLADGMMKRFIQIIDKMAKVAPKHAETYEVIREFHQLSRKIDESLLGTVSSDWYQFEKVISNELILPGKPVRTILAQETMKETRVSKSSDSSEVVDLTKEDSNKTTKSDSQPSRTFTSC